MSIYDKSSLVLIPSGTKTGKVFSQKPVSGDGDFTFTRASAATRVNADGNIEKETSNLLLQSNSFDTTWAQPNASVTGGQSGYDGSSDAWLLQNNAGFTTTANVRQNLSLGSSVRSFSVYAKQGNVDWLRILMYDGSIPHQCWFNLTDGSTANASDIIDSKSTSVGGGWYRCEISANTNITSVNIYPTSVAGSSFSDNGGSIYIQDAQLNQGLIAQEVITTTTAAVYGGITDNTPRLDYTDSSCPALLLEPQRTNKCPNSELYGTSFINTSVTRNAVSAPSGYIEAGRLLDNNSLGEHLLGHNFSSFASGETHSISCFFKADATGGRAVIRYYGGSWVYAVYNLDSGEVEVENGGITADIVPYANGWYRCILTHTTTLNYAPMVTQIGIANGNNDFFYQGASNLGLYFYGYQAETGSYPTSYIPTYGSSVSRVVETCFKTGVSDLIGQTEGVLYCEFINKIDNDGGIYNMLLTISDSANDYAFISKRNPTGIDINLGTNANIYITSGIFNTDGATYKVAAAYKNNDFVVYVNGVQIWSDTSGTIAFSNADKLSLGSYYTQTLNFNSGIKQALLFKTRLSNEELATLTTI